MVRVLGLEPRGTPDAAGQDQIAKTGGETLDLGLDPRQQIAPPAVRDVAIRPSRVAPFWGPRRVEERRLYQDDVRRLRHLALRHRRFAADDLLEAGSEMDGRRLGACRCSPWDRPAQGVVCLEHARSEPEAGEPPAI